jgi:hypothetical protein
MRKYVESRSLKLFIEARREGSEDIAVSCVIQIKLIETGHKVRAHQYEIRCRPVPYPYLRLPHGIVKKDRQDIACDLYHYRVVSDDVYVWVRVVAPLQRTLMCLRMDGISGYGANVERVRATEKLEMRAIK